MKNQSDLSICIMTTVSNSIKAFYPGQIEALQKAGFRVTIICAEDSSLSSFLPEGVIYIPVSFTRTLNPFVDILNLVKLFRLFRKEKFSIVQYSSPKASLLASIASRLAGISCRIYLLWGLYYMGQKGMAKTLLKWFEKITCAMSSRVVPIAHEMIDFAVREKLVKREKCTVLLKGSACGVDLDLYNPEKWTDAGAQIRSEYGIPQEAIVIGTVARLTGDKGIHELVRAFVRLTQNHSNLCLLLVGQSEEKDRLDPDVENLIQEHSCIFAVGKQANPIPFYKAMDIFCLPTYREGFGEVNLEAQAMGLPVVSTDIIGPRESVENGQTGFLVEPKNENALLEPLEKLIQSPELRTKMGYQGRLRIARLFDRRKMIEAMVRHRLDMCRK